VGDNAMSELELFLIVMIIELAFVLAAINDLKKTFLKKWREEAAQGKPTSAM